MRCDNPVFVMAMRQRSRNRRAPWVLLCCLLLVIAAAGSELLPYARGAHPGHFLLNRSIDIYYSGCESVRTYLGVMADASSRWYARPPLPAIARSCLEFLLLCQGVGSALFISLAIGGEFASMSRQGRMEPVRLTLQTPKEIVRGCLLATVLQAWVLLLVPLPIANVVLLLGGVSPMQMTCAYFTLAAGALLFTSIALCVAALATRPGMGILLALSACAALLLETSARLQVARPLAVTPLSPAGRSLRCLEACVWVWLNPVLASIHVISPGSVLGAAPIGLGWSVSVLVSLALAWALTTLAARLLHWRHLRLR